MPVKRQKPDHAPARPRVALDVARLTSVLTERRQQLGWSLRELAERSQVSTSAVHALEHGHTGIQLDNFVSILAALDLRPDQVLVVEGAAEPLEPTALEKEIEAIRGLKDPAEALRRLSALLER